jgi:sulfatase modifying factor 1
MRWVCMHPSGRGKYGHDDLAGNVWEWVLDWYTESIQDGPCHQDVDSSMIRDAMADCANLHGGDWRGQRGGSFLNGPLDQTSFSRSAGDPTRSGNASGFRCARDPK